jgi:hypothetical protein
MVGCLNAMFPLKMIASALAATQCMSVDVGLLLGSLGSVACATAMWVTLRHGTPVAIGSDLPALVLFVGRFL